MRLIEVHIYILELLKMLHKMKVGGWRGLVGGVGGAPPSIFATVCGDPGHFQQAEAGIQMSQHGPGHRNKTLLS